MRDDRSSRCGSEGIKHGCKLEIGHNVGIVRIVLLQVLALEPLVNDVVGLVLDSVGLKEMCIK
jgi:hypothetical protein